MALALEAEKNGVTIKEGTEVFDLKEALLNGTKKDNCLLQYYFAFVRTP